MNGSLILETLLLILNVDPRTLKAVYGSHDLKLIRGKPIHSVSHPGATSANPPPPPLPNIMSVNQTDPISRKLYLPYMELTKNVRL